MDKIRVVSLFSGIGGFEEGILKSLGDKAEIVLASEIDKHAQKSYQAIYGQEPSGDITKIHALDIPDHELLVGGFPCQAFSTAGKRLGFAEARGTLFFEIARIAKEKQPETMVLENVKGLINHDDGKTLETILRVLNDIGYTVDFEVLHSKFFGLPQSRERIFIIAKRNDLVSPEEWKIKGNNITAKAKKRLKEEIIQFNFNFPVQDKVEKTLKDILEDDVDESFYLSEDKTRGLIEHKKEIPAFIPKEDGINKTLRTTGHYSATKKHNFCQVAVKVKPQLFGKLTVHKYEKDNKVYSDEAISPTILAQGSVIQIAEDRFRIRRLTSLECWRLQGFSDENYFKAKDSGVSLRQLYKQAGNAVSVPVISALIEQVFNK